MMKNNKLLLKCTLFLTFIITPIVSAFDPTFEGVSYEVKKFLDLLLGILAPFLEIVMGEYSTSDFFFSKILVLVLLIIICKKVLEKTPIGDNKNVSLILSILISVLAVRFINENNFFEAIFLQYGVLGIAITTILPLVIFFYFVHNTNVGTFGRKMFWAIYIVTMTGIWISKSGEIPTAANWIYATLILLAILFAAIDKTIHAYFGLSNFKAFEKDINKKRIRELKKELQDITDHHNNDRMSWKEYKEEREAIREQIKELSKE